MTTLDRFIPEPRLHQLDHVDVAVPAEVAWKAACEIDLAGSPIAHALFWLRTVPDRLRGRPGTPGRMPLSDVGKSGPGFRRLEDGPLALTVGAIGKFWEPTIVWADAAPERFAAFGEPGFGKVAWELRCEPRGETACRIVLELRVTATDDDAWRKFGRYFRLIGPFSHMLRKQMLGALQKQLGTLEDAEGTRALPGDEIIAEPKAESTDAITIEAPPEKVFPWLLQMGGGRAGWYSYDRLDNDGVPSAREIVPALQPLRPGDILPFFAGSDDGFVVDRIEAPHTLVLSAGMDLAKRRSILPGEPLPARYFRSTWAFLLEPYGSGATRLRVRARVDFRPSRLRLRAWWMSKVHAVMEAEQLRNLKRRAEGAVPRETLSEMTEGVEGAFRIVASLATPFRRGERLHEGLTEAEANGVFPGDGRVPSPRFTWTHAVEVDAPPAEVWPWVVQIGQDRAGFYSYQALENVAGCDIVNADRIHPEWQQRKAGDLLKLHAGVPPMTIVQIEEGRYLVAQIHTVEGDRYANVSWMFQVEPLPGRRSRVVSRFRSSTSDDIAHRLLFGPYLVEAVGGVMDRRMLRGIKERVERARPLTHLAMVPG